MIPPEAQQVTFRFYKAIDYLIKVKALRGRQTFCLKYGIDKRYFYLIEKRPDMNSLKVAWIVYLVRDYEISADWLLLGEGKIMYVK